jgi:serine protease AprX
VAPNGPVHVQASGEGGDPVRSVYREAMGATDLHAEGTTGQGVTVALVDTGVSPVGDLAGRIRPVTNPLTGWSEPCVDFSGEGHCSDSYGHGTFMAGIILGDGSASDGAFAGVAPGAELVSLKVAGRDGSSDVSKVLAAIQWVVSHRDEHDIRVMNLSLGTDATQSWRVDPFNYAVERAWDAGIVVTVAASNLGPSDGSILKPADDPWVLTVGAIDDHGTVPGGDDLLPDFSSRGPTASGLAKPDVVAPGARLVSLRAPGSEIDQLFPEVVDATYRRGSGTSMAAAAVSGGVALLLERHPGWSPDQVKEALRATAVPTASADPMAVGAGAVDLAGAAVAPVPASDQGLAQSSGLGSLDLSRGSVQVRTDTLLGTVLGAVLGTTLTAQMLLWDPLAFTTRNWDFSTWRTSVFLLHRWYGTRWHGNDWTGNWHGNNWHGNNWQGAWDGATGGGGERSTEQYGSPWKGAAWYGLWE